MTVTGTRCAARTLFLALFLVTTVLPAGAAPPYAGRPLGEVLRELENEGLRLIFTDRVVRPEMRVSEEPRGRRPRAVLNALLKPHGLEARKAPGGILMIVRTERGDGEDAADASLPSTSDEIDVVSNRLPVLADDLSSVALLPGDLRALPHVGDDAVRPIVLLPGTSSNDLSAQFSVRGGNNDEVLVLLDGVEVLEPYHLKDFGNAFSILAPSILGEVELSTGGFSAQFGDRMGGVLEMRSLDPDWPRRAELGASFFEASTALSGQRPEDRWLVALRRSLLEIPRAVLEASENPSFWDVFLKWDHELAPGRNLVGEGLFATDRLDFLEDGEDGRERFRNRYESLYGWLEYHAVPRRDLFVLGRASWSHVERHREGDESDAEGQRTLSDLRRLDVAALAFDWNRELAARHELMAGLEARDLDVDYDYVNTRDLTEPLADVRDQPRSGTTRFDERFRGRQWAFYASDRYRPSERFTLEGGLRFDSSSILDDNHHVSPRLNVDAVLGSGERPHRLRFAWGYFHQIQRLYELQVEDGETAFSGAERAEHRILGYERSFPRPAGPLVLRVELYERRVRDPRARYENLFDPLGIVPELASDRVRVAPSSRRAHGVEVFLAGRGRPAGRPLDFFVSYVWSRSFDRIDGRDVPRAVDQPHALRFDVGVDLARGWRLDVAGEVRDGWPTTAVRVVDGTPVLGQLRGERMPVYRRLDLRLARLFKTAHGEVELFLTAQNLTAARNVRGYKWTFADGEAMREEKTWGRAVPNLGLRWRF